MNVNQIKRIIDELRVLRAEIFQDEKIKEKHNITCAILDLELFIEKNQ